MDSAATPSYGMMNGGSSSGSHQAMAPPRAMAGGGTQLPRPPHRQMNSIKYNNNEASSSSQQPQQQQQQQQHAYYAQHDQYQPQHQSSSSSMMRPSTSSYSGASSSGAGPSTSHDSVYAPQRVYGKRDNQNMIMHHDPTRSGSHSPLIEDTREDHSPQQLQLHHPSTSRAYQQPPQMMMHQQPPMMMQQHQLHQQHQQQQHHNVLPPKLTMQAHQPTEMTVNHTTTPPVLHQLQPPPRHTPAQINHDNSNNVRQNMGEDDDEPLVLAEGGAGEGSYYAATNSPEKGHVFPDQERFLPIANISRLMKNMIPGSGKIAKEAKECVQECVSEFISFLTSEACEKCIAKRKTITADDLYEALIQLGFDNYGEPMRNFLEKWRRAHKMVHSVPRLPFNIFDPRLLRKEMPMTEIPQGLNNLTIDDISSAQMNLDGTRTIEIDGAKVQIFTDSQVQEMEQEARATGKPVPFIMYKPTPLLNPRESEEKEPEIEVNENQAMLDNEPIIITNDAHDLITEPDPTVREEGTTLKPLAVSDAVSPDGPMNPLLEETQMSIYIDPLTKQHYVAVEAEGAVKLYPITINESAGTMQIVGAEDEPMSISSSSLSQQQGPDDGQYGAQQQQQQHQQNDVLEINDTDVNAMFIQPMGATQNEEQDEDHPPTQSSSAIEGSPSRTTRAGAKRTRGDPEYVSPQHQPNVAHVKRTRGMQHHQ